MSELSRLRIKSPTESLLFTIFLILVLLPLFQAAILTWQEYLRLVVITVGLSFCFLRQNRHENSPLRSFHVAGIVALGFMFVVTQFDPATSAHSSIIPSDPLNAVFLVALVLSSLAFLVLILFRKPRGKLNILDWVVMGGIASALMISMGSYLLFRGTFPLYSSAKFVIYGLLWFTLTRWLPTAPEAEGRLTRLMLLIFSLVCLIGVSRIGMAFYSFQTGRLAQNAGAFPKAILNFEDSASESVFLQLGILHDASVFAKAEVLYHQGKKNEAAKALSMEDGFVLTIPSKTWEGPAGGMLYTNIGCWKDLTLYEGHIVINIYARGKPALGVWPRMRVRLGNRVMGEVEVNTRDAQVYTFETRVSRGRQRLEVSFINDYFDPPENRDLWVEQAEIRYTEIDWR